MANAQTAVNAAKNSCRRTCPVEIWPTGQETDRSLRPRWNGS